MKALIQRVKYASVAVEGETIGAIDYGILALIGVEPNDDEASAKRLIDRLINYRIFSDHEGKMNNSLVDVKGGLLLVSQFTLAADTRKGLRPSFSSAASPQLGEELYNTLLSYAQSIHPNVESGSFGAHMEIELLNDGPVTFLLEV